VRRRSGKELQRSVGRRIAEVRAARKLTQEKLAERLDVSARYLQEVERGAENLTIQTIAKIGRSLGVDASALFSAPRNKPGRRPR
jgi:transcriptional regulator with XRE-family HTH domain